MALLLPERAAITRHGWCSSAAEQISAGVGLLLPIAARGPAYATSRPATSWRAITTMSFSQAKRRSR
jgi:hypothetical protein